MPARSAVLAFAAVCAMPLLWVGPGAPASAQSEAAPAPQVRQRAGATHSVPEGLTIATFNLGDVRTEQLLTGNDERCKRLAAAIQHIQPDIILLNEIAYDEPGVVEHAPAPGLNGQRFAENYLSIAQAPGLEPVRMNAFMAPSNTGVFSGHDLDNSGAADPDSTGRDYGGDCLGYGEFPGQYAMALLVRDDLGILTDKVRTFRNFKWKDMPGALLPPANADGTGDWYSDEELSVLPLSSKSHWDVPILLPTGVVLHALCSHPTPPVFDGPEDRNGRRNHDEIRFWADYTARQPSRRAYIVDDNGVRGGLPRTESFAILGDLNADPERGDSRDNPIGAHLLMHPRIEAHVVPRSRTRIDELRDEHTANFRLRVDYVLPSRDLTVFTSGVWRSEQDLAAAVAEPGSFDWTQFPSDHYVVWVRVIMPEPDEPEPESAGR